MSETSTCPVCEERFDHGRSHDTSTRPFCSGRCREECIGEGTCILNWWLDDGNLPAEAPDRWGDCVYNVFPGTPCPDCGMNIRMILGPIESLEPYARVRMKICPETIGFDQPVYLDCSRCDWHDVAEWERIRSELKKMI